MIGIPFAPGHVDAEGRLVRTCPVCGAECIEVTDPEGEQLTDSYGSHYLAAHDNPEGGTDEQR
jgi:hypothetical protein